MNFSYSTIADVHAMANEYPDRKDDLQKFALELERVGVAWFDDTEYIYRDSAYGMEIVSMEDFESENEDDEEE